MRERQRVAVGLLLAVVAAGGARAGWAGPPLIDPHALGGRTAVDAFLRAHAGEWYSEATLGDYRVLDLDLDGRFDLVATIDVSGRRFFNRLVVLHDADEGLTVQEVEVWNMESLAGVVEHLGGDGQPVLLLRQSLTPYLGARPMATWTAVFRFEGGRLSDRSAKFPQLYERDVLPRVERELAGRSAGGTEAPYRRDVLTIERDKILRVLGRQPDAGLASALTWARSEDPVRRIFALAVLADIPGADAGAALKALSEDSDPEVAALARVRAEVRDRKAAVR